MPQKLAAEFFGTFWLVFYGCGSAVLAAAFPEVGIGLLGVALAFGLTEVTMAHAVGRFSGRHFNPAASVGMVVRGRMPASDPIGHIVAQVVGGIVAGAVLQFISSFHGIGGMIYLLVSNAFTRRQMFPIGCKMP